MLPPFIKPCPFCRSTAEYTCSQGKSYVKCTNILCGCTGPVCFVSDTYISKDAAIKKWNERVGDQDK